jgi:membrane-associated protease RseP (regulator of RpoE activity)
MRLIHCSVALALAAPLACADEPPAKSSPPIMVPYRLTKTQHVLVRAKINGKGPYNFILDTGAPALFVAKKVAGALEVPSAKVGWTTFDRFEVEGGVVFEKAQGRVDNLFQLEGMNGLGLAGVELHGVIGYNLLARYRIEYDFTKPKLSWTKLVFDPPAVGGLGGRSAPAGLEMIGNMMKFAGAIMGLKANFAVQPRGFLGAELAEKDLNVVVKSVIPEGPAAKAGIKAGDTIKHVGDDEIESLSDVARKLAKGEGTEVKLMITRGGKDQEITVELGRGL